MSVMPCDSLCLCVVWAWLVGWLGLGLASQRLRFGWVLNFPFHSWGQHPTTYIYNALCVLMFGSGLGIVGWMARLGFGL